MAMIQCPECGESVSDRAKKCIHCGYELIPDEKKVCIECGAELEEGETVCQKCGCPIEDENVSMEVEPQKVEVTGVQVSQKSKKKIGIVVAVILAMVLAIFGVQQIRKNEAAKQYSANLELATVTMLSGASDAETCGNLIKKVWYNAIYEERDSSTDKFTRPNGYFVGDFNEALQNLFSDGSFSTCIRDIKTNQETVQELMKDMKNPPAEYEDAYEDLEKFYNAYLELTNLAINPTGNLNTFSSNFNDADTATGNAYSAMSLHIED